MEGGSCDLYEGATLAFTYTEENCEKLQDS